jgi:hypothetical protein
VNGRQRREEQAATRLNTKKKVTKTHQPRKTMNHNRLHINKTAPTIFAGCLVCAIFSAGDAQADDALVAAPPKAWSGTATLGATLSRGNTKNFLGSVVLDLKRSWTKDELLFGASGGYGENTVTSNGTSVDTTTDSYVRGFGQWNHLFSTRTYAGLRLTGDHDDVAALAYRFTGTPLIGYYFIRETNSTLAGEFGPSYIREKFFGEDIHSYLGLRFGERGEHKFASHARIWESVEWFPKVEDFNNYLVVAEAGVSAPISKAFSISLIAQDNYKSVPAAGKLKNDFKLIAGLTYNF